MRTAAGSCLMTNVTHEQVDKLEEALAVRVPTGWSFPEALVVLRDSIDGSKSEVAPLRNCPDCGATPGEMHAQGCDVERCPNCGGQAITCGCLGLRPLLAWTGIWPGVAECQEFGWYARLVPGSKHVWVRCAATDDGASPDLNRLYAEGVWDPVAGRFRKKQGEN